MDRTTHIQIDRIEEKLDKTIEGIGIIMNLNTNDTILGFLEAEVYSDEGKLKHLAKDDKLQKFYEDLNIESDEVDEDDGTEPEEGIESDGRESAEPNEYTQ